MTLLDLRPHLRPLKVGGEGGGYVLEKKFLEVTLSPFSLPLAPPTTFKH